MAGVNRSNVAVTDTFDTWRLRTNEINTSLNEGTNAITADTIMWRDDDGSYIANTATINTISVIHDTTTTAISVTSALAAATDGTVASIKTTGGIYAALASKVAGNFIVGSNLTVDGATTLGSDGTDTFSVNATLSTDVIPTTTNSVDLGSSTKQYAETHFQKQTMVGSASESGNTLGITGSAGASVGISVINNTLTSGGLFSISSSATDATARNLALITQSGEAGAAGVAGVTALKIATTSGRGVFITAADTDGEEAFEIDSEIAIANTITIDAATTTATGAYFNFPSLSSGARGIDVVSASPSLSSDSAVVEIRQTHGLGTAANSAVLSVKQAGDGTYGLKIDSSHATANSSMRIDSIATTKNVIEVVDNALASGDMFNMSTSGAHSGQMISLQSTNTADSARGEALLIDYRTANTDANAIRVTDGSVDTFSVTSKGDVTMAGNLHVKGTTTQINTTTTIARDKSIILGAQSEIKTDAIYTAASPPVVTSTAHGLEDTNVIFVVASSATSSSTVGVPSEALFTVSNKTDNTFELEALPERVILETATVSGDATGYLVLDSTNGTADAGDNIIMQVDVDATGDSNRTFSWTGPQTDAAVDDAGLVVPGNSAKHYVKWDDSDNYWKLNDSVMVDSSGQFVLPKGTTADRPAATITGGTLAAATPGAMRYNTTSSKFEGIETGTAFQNMSTESFSIAVAIALGS